MKASPQVTDILSHYEIEHYIESLNQFEIEQYGSKQWYKQDQILQKLNVQAHVNAVMKSDQDIMDSCVTFDKVRLLVYDLILSEMWKQHVFPSLRKHFTQISSLRSYIAIQHEAVLCNLLEVIFFHRTAVEAAENYLLEVIDYCYRKLAQLISNPPPKKILKKTVQEYMDRTPEDELKEQYDSVNFQTQMMCLSITRYIADQLRHLPVNIVHHFVVENDFFFLLVPLIEEKPWIRTNHADQREIFENSKWTIVEKKDYSRLPVLEAQVWITLYDVFMDPECRRKYEFSDFKKNNLIRVRKYMNELLLDQIPNLVDMLRSLEELSLMNVQNQQSSNPFIIQQLPEIRNLICKNKDWKAIALYQQENYFVQNDASVNEDMKQLAELYGTQVFEGLLEGFHCENCSKESTKRCSKCKSVWYCSRECQIENWKVHKLTCNKVEEKANPQKSSNEEGRETAKKEQNMVEVVNTQEKIIVQEQNKVDFDEVD